MILDFGQLDDGQKIHQICLQNEGMQAKILTYGAIVQDLRMNSHPAPLVLGFDTLEGYTDHPGQYGALVGRCANRIADASCVVGGNKIQLDANLDNQHHIHGGAIGASKKIWKIEDVTQHSVTMSITFLSGEMGYPGNMEAHVQISLSDINCLELRVTAHCDQDTICNFAHHGFFNLDGSDTILDHELRVHTDRFLPIDDQGLPVGHVASSIGTEFDFGDFKTLKQGPTILDHNYCFQNKTSQPRDIVSLQSKKSGIGLLVRSTEPGVQIYDGGNIFSPVLGLGGRHMKAHAGIAIEPQIWPDAVHHGHFPTAILRAGQLYSQHTQYIFEHCTG